MSTTAIHTTFYRHLNESETCKKIMLSNEQYARLTSYIRNSFKENNEGHYMLIDTDANYSEDDAFYEAIGSYSLFHTCNTWTNNSLKVCGQKACLWTIFDTGIFLKYN